MSTESKRCSGPCRRELALTEFSRDRSRRDGLTRYCKQCNREKSRRYRERKERERRQMRSDLESHGARVVPTKMWLVLLREGQRSSCSPWEVMRRALHHYLQVRR